MAATPMMMYDWDVFWGDGEKATVVVPFGPTAPYDLIGIDNSWVDKLEVYYPKFRRVISELPGAHIVVNHPREALPEEEHHWNMKGYK